MSDVSDIVASILPTLGELLNYIALAVIAYLTHKARQIYAEIAQNTKLTETVAEHTNGMLAELRRQVQMLTEQTAALKQRLQVQQLLIDHYRNIVQYVKTHPDGVRLLNEYQAKRRVAMHDDYLAELERRFTSSSQPPMEGAQG